MIESEQVWLLLLDELREQRERYGSPSTAASSGVLRWQGYGKIAAYCRVLALDVTNDVTFNEPDKVLMEANSRLASEARHG